MFLFIRASLLPSFLLVLLLCLILAALGCVRFVEYTDVTFAAFLHGMLTGQPEGIFNNYNMLFGWAPVMERIQIAVPNIPIYGLFVVLISALWVWQVFLFVRYFFVLHSISVLWYLPLFMLALLLIIFFQITQVSILFQGSVWMLMLLKLKDGRSDLIPGWPFLTLSSVLASSLRFEAAFLVFVFFAPFAAMVMREHCRWSWVRTVMVLGGITLLLIAATLEGSRARNADDQRYAVLRGYKVAAWDQGEDLLRYAKSERDSVKLGAFGELFMADYTQLNPDSLAKLGVPRMDKELGLMLKSITDIRRRASTAAWTLMQSIRMMGYSGPLIAVLWLWLMHPLLWTSGQAMRKLLFSQLYLFFSILIISYVLKMEARFLLPIMWLNLLVVFGFGSTWQVVREVHYRRAKRLFLPIAAVLASLLIWSKVEQLRHLIQSEQQTAAWLLDQDMNRFEHVVFDYQSIGLLFNDAFDHPVVPVSQTNLAMDFGYLCFYQSHRDRWLQASGTNTFPEQIAAMADPGVLWLTSENRLSLWTAYLQRLYGLDLSVLDASPVPARTWFQSTPLDIQGFRLAAKNTLP
jgi:hypothetical protein